MESHAQAIANTDSQHRGLRCDGRSVGKVSGVCGKSVSLSSFNVSPTWMGDMPELGLTTRADFQAFNLMLMNDDTEHVNNILERVLA